MITLLFAYIFHPGIFNTSKVFRTGEEPSERHRFKFAQGGGDFGGLGGPGGGAGGNLWGMMQPPNLMNPQMPNAFGPPPPPIPFRRRRDLNDLLSGGDLTSTTTTPASVIINAVLMNHTQIMRQMFDPMFTAPQMFIPSMSTLPNNMMNPNGGEPEPAPPDNTYKDRWITYLVPMILQVRLSSIKILFKSIYEYIKRNKIEILVEIIKK